MKRPNIVFLDEYTMLGTPLDPIRRLGDYTGYADSTPEQAVERTRTADVVVVNKVQLKGDTLRAMSHVRLICIAATGMNNIDLELAAELGITVRNAVDYSTHSVSEATFAAVLGLMRQTAYYDRYVKSGAYSASACIFHAGRPISQLYGKRWGVIGLGHIGSEVARLATAFGCVVSYHSTSGANRRDDYPELALDELLRTSDVVTIHAPLSRRTYHLIGYEQLKLMKPTAVIVNLARGHIIEEEGLARALNEGLIAGSGLDVFSREPLPADSPLLKIEDPYKLVLSPHTGWAASESLSALVTKIADNIRDFYKF